MLFKFTPREGRFFDLFEKSADALVEAAYEFRNLLQDMGNAERRSATIEDIEHRADEITHQTIELLHTTFITPIDREDIHSLISSMDDVVDIIEAASQRVLLYQINRSTPEAVAMADVCVKSCERVKAAVHGLNNLKNPKQMIQDCIEINRLENEADHLLRLAIAKLFKEEPDTRQLIKYKELYELLESCTDRCEDVANIIEGIVLEYA